jgi:hypothetical protein
VELFTKINDLQIISARITGHLLVVKIQFITINEWYRVRVMVNSIEDLLTLHTFFLSFQENAINCKRQEGKR